MSGRQYADKQRFPVVGQEEKWDGKIPAASGYDEGLFRGLETDSSDDDSWLESSIVTNSKSESVHHRSAYGHGRVSNSDSTFPRENASGSHSAIRKAGAAGE